MLHGALAASGEKSLEQGSAVGSENARGDFDLMIQARVGKHFEAGTHGAAFRVIATINEARNAGLDDGAGTHAARLDGDVQGGGGQAIVAESAGSFAEHHHFGVGGGVAITDGAIAGTRDDGGFVNEERADRDFAGGSRETCFFESLAHEFAFDVHAGENSTSTKRLNTDAVEFRKETEMAATNAACLTIQ